MMEKKSIEDSDSDDSDFKISLEDLSDESSALESDSTTSEIDENPSSTSSTKPKLNKKRKKRVESSLKKNKIDTSSNYVNCINTNNIEGHPDKEKEKTDLLWNSFLNSTGNSKNLDNKLHESLQNPQSLIETVPKQDSNCKMNERLISFEQIKTNKCTNSTNPQNTTQQPNDLKRRGLSNILRSISKKSKLNTLEKSKQDWNEFKKEHNLNEEITNFNRGKNGYLEKQDFLQRTDSRQFEIEKNLRNSERRRTK